MRLSSFDKMFEGAARLQHLPRCGPVSCFAAGVEEGGTGRVAVPTQPAWVNRFKR